VLCLGGSSRGRRARPASEYGCYVAVTGTRGGATAAAGPFMLPSLRIRVSGLDPIAHSVAQMAAHVGLVFQDPEMQLVSVYVEHEVAFGCENLCVDVETMAARVERYLRLFGLAALPKTPCTELSGGQKQRVALAAVLAMEPRLIALDEPTSFLDGDGTQMLVECLRRLHGQRDQTVVIIEHRVDPLIDLVDRVIVMEHGRVVYDGAPHEVYVPHQRRLVAAGVWVPQIVELADVVETATAAPPPFPPMTADRLIGGIRGQNLTLAAVAPRVRVPDPPTDTLVEVQRASFSYDPGVDAVRGVATTLRRGEIVVITGPNGSGKTTLGKMLTGLLRCTSGAVLYRGRDLRSWRFAELALEIGYVFQNVEVMFIKPTVAEEVQLSFTRAGRAAEASPAAIAAILARNDLLAMENANPLDLSAGEKRRLTFAMMEPLRPSILVLDEPVASLDYHGTLQLLDVIVALRDRGTTLCIISHDTRVMAEVADRVITLEHGRIVGDESAHAFFSARDTKTAPWLSEPPVVSVSRAIADTGTVALSTTEFASRLRVRDE
jgi:energy-coupling factor transport system ATP-binding protein